MGHPAKDEVLLIGDSLTSDIQGGQNYGIDTCWFNPERKMPPQPVIWTFEIRKLNELWCILELPTNHTNPAKELRIEHG
jgi:2-haloacid dehalogenase